MTTTTKDFKINNGLTVGGTAQFDSNLILGTTPISFNTETNRLQVYVNDAWEQVAMLSDADILSFEDIGITVDYNGQAVFIVQGNGVTANGALKFLDGGLASTSSWMYSFDSGIIS